MSHLQERLVLNERQRQQGRGMIIRSKSPRAVTADKAMRLARYFGTSAQFWLNLQAAYDLSVAEAERGKAIEREVRPRAAQADSRSSSSSALASFRSFVSKPSVNQP